MIGEVPVQFLPAYNDLAEEAVRQAKSLTFKDLPIRVITPEYLIALALDPPANNARRKERAAMLRDTAGVDTEALTALLARYNLSW